MSFFGLNIKLRFPNQKPSHIILANEIDFIQMTTGFLIP